MCENKKAMLECLELAIDSNLMEDAGRISKDLEEYGLELKKLKGEYLRNIDIKLERMNDVIEDIEKEKKRLVASCTEFPGTKMTGIDYSAVRVKGSGYHPGLIDIVSQIDGLQKNLQKLFEERSQLLHKKEKIVDLIKAGEDVGSKIYYYRAVLGWTQERTAKKVGYSVRQIQRIEKKIAE